MIVYFLSNLSKLVWKILHWSMKKEKERKPNTLHISHALHLIYFYFHSDYSHSSPFGATPSSRGLVLTALTVDSYRFAWSGMAYQMVGISSGNRCFFENWINPSEFVCIVCVRGGFSEFPPIFTPSSNVIPVNMQRNSPNRLSLFDSTCVFFSFLIDDSTLPWLQLCSPNLLFWPLTAICFVLFKPYPDHDPSDMLFDFPHGESTFYSYSNPPHTHTHLY